MSPRVAPSEEKSPGLAAVQVGMKDIARADYGSGYDVGRRGRSPPCQTTVLALFMANERHGQKCWDAPPPPGCVDSGVEPKGGSAYHMGAEPEPEENGEKIPTY